MSTNYSSMMFGGKMLFECDVRWKNEEENTLVLAELTPSEDCNIEVSWKMIQSGCANLKPSEQQTM